MKRSILIIIALMTIQQLWSQGPPAGVTGGAVSALADHIMEDDSLSIHYFKIDNLDKKYAYTDTSLHGQTHNYDPARLTDVDYIHLGNQGSAASSLLYQADPYIGFHIGHTQYDLYKYQLEDFKFYESNIPMVNASFSPMGSQDNFVFTTDFARSFDDGVSVSANYRRIFQEGLYNQQRTRLTNFGVSLRLHKPLSKYTAFLSMISNVSQEEYNGGLNPDDIDPSTLGNRDILSTTIGDGNTRHQQKYYSLINYYKLNSKYSNKDLLVRYDIGYDNSYYRYFDPITADPTQQDTFHYGQFLTDQRGIRQYTRVNKLTNALYLYLSDKNRLNVRAGIVYDRYSIEQDVVESSFDNVYLDLDGDIPFLNQLTLITKAQLGIGDGIGDFNIDAALDINIGKIGSLQGGISLYRQTPSLLQQSVYVSQVQVWNNTSLIKPVGSDLYARLTIPSLRLTAEFHQQIISNAIYFDIEANPIQSDEVFTATSLNISNKLSYGIFHLENSFLLQLMNENIYGRPTYWSKHNFYMQFRMFKKNLLSRWGVETRLATAYDGLAYNGALGAYHLSGEEIETYPMTDVYFSGKVSKFRIFVKLENLLQLIDENRVDFRVQNHPTQDWSIRFGIEWLFAG